MSQMRQNPEFFAVAAFGAVLILGLSGAPMWMPVAIGAMYGIDELFALRSSPADCGRGKHRAVRQQAGMIASRVGAILMAYGLALSLRLLGSA